MGRSIVIGQLEKIFGYNFVFYSYRYVFVCV